MRNSSPVERPCAENVTGLKSTTEAAVPVPILRNREVGERSQRVEVPTKVGMDCWEVRIQALVAIKVVRIHLAVSLRFPGEGSSAQG